MVIVNSKESEIERSEWKILNVFDVDKFIEIDNNLLFKQTTVRGLH